ncbi:hypothetical protein SAMN02910456_02648 [Ruminococcaceae bacterium YRB3002]|nr:hypothetical protein SAMN02910456_02648 [Ruminococcaceae bacterium YRB3002]
MDNEELNLDEIMQIDGGQSEVAKYAYALASQRGMLYADGSVDTAALSAGLTQEERAKLMEMVRMTRPLSSPDLRPLGRGVPDTGRKL